MGYEYKKDTETCTLCPAGTYSINKNPMNDFDCEICPAHVTCAGGASLEINKGYWIEDSFTTTFASYECRDARRCVGGQYNASTMCANSTGGYLCQ